MTTLLIPRTKWVCPNCPVEAITHVAQQHTEMHVCKGMKGLTVPMVREGTKAIHRSVEREDYINGEAVQTDADGRPVMSVITEREDGQDVTVFAPTAKGSGAAGP
jgi:hypothetical protein